MKIFENRSVRRLSAVLCGMVFLLSLGVNAFAKPGNADYKGDPNWAVTFTTDGKDLKSNFSQKEFQNVFKSMQPGDDAEVTLKLTNSNAKTVNWYMDNDVISSLEESGDSNTAGGSYSYILTYHSPNSDVGDIELYNSNGIGGEYTTKRANVGLKEINNGYLMDYDENNVNPKTGEKYFYLDQLKNGQTGNLSLYIKLDGETQGNSYQDTLAALEMKFAVEMSEVTPTPTPTGTPTPTTTPKSSSSSRTSKAVKTGDDNPNVLLIVLMGVSGLVLLILAIIGVKSRKRADAAPRNAGSAGKREGGKKRE